MAKTTKSEQSGKIKVRIIEFEMEGSDESLQESLKSFAAALNRGSNGAQHKAIRQDQVRQLETSSSAPRGETVDEVEALEPDTDESPIAAPKKPRKASRIVPAEVLQDINLNDIEPRFIDFAATKNPRTDMAKYLVIAYWFKFYKKITDLTANHFYTAYKIAGWKVPSNVALPMRELRASRDGRFSNGEEVGTYTINHIGENSVEMMGGQ